MRGPGALLALLALIACRPNRDEFYAHTYACRSIEDVADACGTDRQGRPMRCFAGQQLGLSDFCTPTCDAASPVATGAMCLASSTSLRTCRPSEDAPGTRGVACGDPDLSCYRTDLLRDEGVCVTGDLCSTDTDCKNAARAVCATTLLRYYYRTIKGLQPDHLTCMQFGCDANGTACPAGESCLPKVLGGASRPADICVPSCDANLNCPPNYQCYRRVSGPSAPAVCIPGLLGFRCLDAADCMIGDCADTGEGFRVCSIPCAGDEDCIPLDGERGTFICAAATPNGPRICSTSESFGGSPCASDDDCHGIGVCTRYSPYSTNTDLGFCLVPCGADGTCAARGGINHTCLDYLPQLEPQPSPPLRAVCYPGKPGIRCHRDDECLPTLSCLDSRELTAADVYEPRRVCSIACERDEDCLTNRHTAAAPTWCDAGTCVLGRPGGRICARSRECSSGSCVASDKLADQGKGVFRCTYPPGGAR